MSQVVSIRRVKHEGAAVYLGEVNGAEAWTSNPVEVVKWLCNGHRTRFNQHRSNRKTAVWSDGVPVLDSAGEQVYVPIGSEGVITLSDKEARKAYSYLRALPVQVIQNAQKEEEVEWWSAVKRRKTLGATGRTRGRMPAFRSAKQHGLKFSAWYHSGRNATFKRTSKVSGVLTITGMNPGAHRDPKSGSCHWSLKITVRLSQDVLPYTSVTVDWDRQKVMFVNQPPARALPAAARR